MQGDVDRAMHLVDQAVDLATRSRHIPTVALVHTYRDAFSAMRRKPDPAAAEFTLDLVREHELSLFIAIGTVRLAWARGSRAIRRECAKRWPFNVAWVISFSNRPTGRCLPKWRLKPGRTRWVSRPWRRNWPR
jgi:hypothetical protein